MTYKTCNGHGMITTVANIHQYFQIVNVRHICNTKILHLNGTTITIREYWWELASVIYQILPTKPLDSSIVALFKSREG